jgi:hypothetical protein
VTGGGSSLVELVQVTLFGFQDRLVGVRVPPVREGHVEEAVEVFGHEGIDLDLHQASVHGGEGVVVISGREFSISPEPQVGGVSGR